MSSTSQELWVQKTNGGDMDYALCRNAPTSQKNLVASEYTEETALKYAIEHHWRVIVFCGGKYYYLKGKEYSISDAALAIAHHGMSNTRKKKKWAWIVDWD